MLFHLEDVTFSYDAEPVLNGISIVLEDACFHGILGPNGCGKTTLVDLLTGHKPPAAGSIRFRGRALASYPKKILAREIALVPQNYNINFPFTAKEIVMMGRYPSIPRFGRPARKDLERVNDIMKKTETDALKNRSITELSGGERQRVVFARALAQHTAVLVLDEATSNLDINHTLGMLNLVADGVKRQRKTVVAVFQDINLAATYCDRLIIMKEGHVISQGRTNAVLTVDTLQSVFNVESKIYFSKFSGSNQVEFRK